MHKCTHMHIQSSRNKPFVRCGLTENLVIFMPLSVYSCIVYIRSTSYMEVETDSLPQLTPSPLTDHAFVCVCVCLCVIFI
jgi:hypothetical protein